MIPASCASVSAEQTWTNSLAARENGSGPSRESTAPRSSPLTYSMIR